MEEKLAEDKQQIAADGADVIPNHAHSEPVGRGSIRVFAIGVMDGLQNAQHLVSFDNFQATDVAVAKKMVMAGVFLYQAVDHVLVFPPVQGGNAQGEVLAAVWYQRNLVLPAKDEGKHAESRTAVPEASRSAAWAK